VTNRWLILVLCVLLFVALVTNWRQSGKLSSTKPENLLSQSREEILSPDITAIRPAETARILRDHNLKVSPLSLSNHQAILQNHQPVTAYPPTITHQPATPANNPKTRTRPSPQDSLTLWQQWQKLMTQNDYQQIPIVNAKLAEQLHKHPNIQVYQEIDGLLAQPTIPFQNKALLIDLLTEIATPQALSQLLNLAQLGNTDPLYIMVVQAISRIGDNRWNGRFHEELSPVLETAWLNATDTDETFLNALGSAIAKIGAPQGVNELLLAVTSKTLTPLADKKADTETIKQEVAFKVIPKVRNPAAVPVLKTWLTQEPVGNPGFELSGAALAEINSPKATEALVDMAKAIPDDASRNVQEWLSKKMDDDKSVNVIKTAQKTGFQSIAIAEVVDNLVGDNNAASIAVSLPTASTAQPKTGDVSMTLSPMINNSQVP
jgi:hypothetical protein